MNATRWFVRVGSLTTLSLTLTLSTAWADPNSVALINATNNPLDSYTGAGIKIGEIDVAAGVADTNNAALAGQVVFTTNLVSNTSGGLDPHATEVAGVMVSTGLTSIGVAPGAKVYSVEVNTPSVPATQTNTVNAAFYLAQSQGTRVINLSMTPSPGTPTVGTDYTSRGLDRLVSQQSQIIVKSAGNNGGPNTITEPGGAFNIITVGAVNNALPGSATNVAGYSSMGPLGDGRVKPDILAPGGSGSVGPLAVPPADNVVMPTSPSGTTQRDAGTSFAAPHVAAAAARLAQYGDTLGGNASDPRIIKAVMLNSAEKLSGWTQQGTTTNGSGVISVIHPLDSSQGAGLLNAGRAYNEMAGGQTFPTQFGNSVIGGLVTNRIGWDWNYAQPSLTNVYMLSTQAFSEVRLTLTWYRDVDASTNNFNVQGLADLNLMLWNSPDTSLTNLSLKAQSISTVDNVEQLYFTDLSVSNYAFGVYYNGYSGGPAPANIFYGLAWEFMTVPEPSTLLLTALGICTLWRLKRKRT